MKLYREYFLTFGVILMLVNFFFGEYYLDSTPEIRWIIIGIIFILGLYFEEKK